MPGPKWLLLFPIISIIHIVVLSALGLLLLVSMFRPALPHGNWMKLAFFAGVGATAMLLGLCVATFVVKGGVGVEFSTVVVASLLLMETGVIGFLAFPSRWRFLSLLLVLLGVLPLLSWRLFNPGP